MKLTSPTFENNKNIPPKYTCDGEGISPPLLISDIPAKTESLALIVDDPDAPSGSFIHWILYSISPAVSKIEEGQIPPEAKEGITSFGESGYGGPCPPSGVHRYVFKMYALDKKIDAAGRVDKNYLEKAMAGHVLNSADLIGLYRRTK